MPNQPLVAIFEPAMAPALAFLHGLARQGVTTVVYGHQGRGIAGWSRDCKDFRTCPDPTQRDLFLPWLRTQLQTGQFMAVAPTTDLIAWYSAELREEFSPSVQQSIAPMQALLICQDKAQFAMRCRELDIATPETRCPRSMSEALSAAAELGYPVMVKPRTHIGVGMNFRGGVAANEQELQALFGPCPIDPSYEIYRAAIPNIEWPILQAFIPYANEAAHCSSGFRDPVHGCHIALTSLRTVCWPPLVGVSTVQHLVDNPETLALTHRIVENILPVGLFDLEFLKIGERYLAIDLNPRGFGYMSLNQAVGHDLVLAWYQSLSGQTSTACAPPTTRVWRDGFVFHLMGLATILFGRSRLKSLRIYLASFGTHPVSVTGSWRDPLPKLAAVLRHLRHPRSFIRNLLRHAAMQD